MKINCKIVKIKTIKFKIKKIEYAIKKKVQDNYKAITNR